MTSCIEMLMGFLEETVLVDYKSFREVGEQYQIDASTVINIIEGIDNAMEELNTRINEISIGIESINETVEQTAIGVNMIAEKDALTVEKAMEGYEQLGESRKQFDELSELMSKFITE